MTGRFLNADGSLNGNGDILGFNMFAYCGNNPCNYSDPSGESLIIVKLLVIGLVAALSLILTGCEHQGDDTLPPRNYVEDSTGNNNCYSYAFELGVSCEPGFISGHGSIIKKEDKSLEGITELVKADLTQIGVNFDVLEDFREPGIGEYIVALKLTTPVDDKYSNFDYHFCVYLEGDTWADVPGRNRVSRYGQINGNSSVWNIVEDNEIVATYDSKTYYFIVSRG